HNEPGSDLGQGPISKELKCFTNQGHERQTVMHPPTLQQPTKSKNFVGHLKECVHLLPDCIYCFRSSFVRRGRLNESSSKKSFRLDLCLWTGHECFSGRPNFSCMASDLQQGGSAH